MIDNQRKQSAVNQKLIKTTSMNDDSNLSKTKLMQAQSSKFVKKSSTLVMAAACDEGQNIIQSNIKSSLGDNSLFSAQEHSV